MAEYSPENSSIFNLLSCQKARKPGIMIIALCDISVPIVGAAISHMRSINEFDLSLENLLQLMG